MKEQWRSIPSYEGHYEVSNFGRVRSIDKTIIDTLGRKRRLKGRILACPIEPITGYKKVVLHKNNESFSISVHRLVATAFHGPSKPGYYAHHVDANRTNNHINNLVWVSPKENIRDAIDSRRLIHAVGIRNGRSVLSPDIVREIRKLYKPYDLQTGARALARKYGVGKSTILQVINGKTWKHVT